MLPCGEYVFDPRSTVAAPVAASWSKWLRRTALGNAAIASSTTLAYRCSDLLAAEDPTKAVAPMPASIVSKIVKIITKITVGITVATIIPMRINNVIILIPL